MKCQAAVLRGVGKDWEIQEITLDPPREGEVLVKMAVAGVCHSDDHYATGDGILPPELVAVIEATGAPVPEYCPPAGWARRCWCGRRSWSGSAVRETG